MFSSFEFKPIDSALAFSEKLCLMTKKTMEEVKQDEDSLMTVIASWDPKFEVDFCNII